MASTATARRPEVAKRTPGEWVAKRDWSVFGRWIVLAVDAPAGHKLIADCLGDDSEGNARAIAALAEVIEAANAVLSDLDEEGICSNAVDDLRVALDQVEPRTLPTLTSNGVRP